MKVLILHDYISATDGSSLAIRGYLKDNTEITEYKILTRIIKDDATDINVTQVNSYEDVLNILRHEEYDVIHNFHLSRYDLFPWVIKAIKELEKNIKIITTINQKPSYPLYWVSPLELKYSDTIIFIDATAYKDKLLYFLPEKRKKKIYYVTSHSEIYSKFYEKRQEYLKKRSDNKIIFGRGSALVKCPPDMIQVFNKISCKNKEFRIYGVDDNSWVSKEAKNYPDIFTYPTLPNEEWLNELSKIDIFLYHLKKDTYSSLDGILGAAMHMGIPVVYYGPEAPKERFIHGKNGFIANSTDEIVRYAQLLANDPVLRNKIGESGRKSTIEKFSWHNTVKLYNELYNLPKPKKNINIPISYRVKFFFMRKGYPRMLRLKNFLIKKFLTKFKSLF